ncbi:predicted protein [Uncinocarpus reesii 1704]|uniref:Lysine-specific metallo-endopeptidase domain-containing protein n=1 Tax=Uncinocarpus reesii (strain UAMH 1704) TaxID=336963 RepID=C4JDK2_UNCRE|nr:uncharacterized protein UREG_00766 [Uncinocarpus reesii 1704]EEP75919.1 predicted protein [Uncinocarpus reesii 1704]
MTTMLKHFDDPEYKLHIVCREKFLSDDDPDSKFFSWTGQIHSRIKFVLMNYMSIVYDPKREIKDNRPMEWGGQQVAYFDKEADLKPCSSGKTEAWSSTNGRWDTGQLVDLIVVCDLALKPSNWNDINSASIASLRKKTFETDSRTIDSIDYANMATILAHEFSHSSLMLCNDRTVDEELGNEPCYGWKLITQLAREKPKFALGNAGLSLDKNDWSTGNSKPVPPDFPGPIGRLSWKNGKWEK